MDKRILLKLQTNPQRLLNPAFKTWKDWIGKEMLTTWMMLQCLQSSTGEEYSNASDVSRIMKSRFKVEVKPQYVREILSALIRAGMPITSERSRGYCALWCPISLDNLNTCGSGKSYSLSQIDEVQ